MKIGFIGTGAIAEAVIVGLVQHSGWEETVLVSARNIERSARLATRFPNVQVVHQNQSSQECLTAGGLNEQILNSAKSEGWFRLMESQLDLVMQRITP